MDALFEAISEWRQPLSLGLLFALLAWESASPFLGFFQRRSRDRIRHGLRNLLLGLINLFIVATLFVSLWAAITAWTAYQGIGLLNLTPLPFWLHLMGAVLMLDLWTYWWHRLNHTLPFLWRFHKVHHSDPHMDVTTANRFHFGEITLSSLLRLPVLLLTGATLGELALYETLMFANTQFHHANIGLPEKADRFLRFFFTSPAMHKVHHSRLPSETNSNYTALLSLWDRLFCSFQLRADAREIHFGLDKTDLSHQQAFTGLMKMPLPELSRWVARGCKKIQKNK